MSGRIFSLLRAKTVGRPLPEHLEKEFRLRLEEVKAIIRPVLPDIQGVNRYRYQFRGLEEYVEAVSLYHYLRHQALITPKQAVKLLGPDIQFELTFNEYMGGVFDLFGEMMRFATNMAGLCSTLTPAGLNSQVAVVEEKEGETMDIDDPSNRQSILNDMQELGSCVELLPFSKAQKSTREKLDVMRSSIQKVERLGYGLVVRGSERQVGWMPDLNDELAQVTES